LKIRNVSELLALDDESFVCAAYQVLLGRAPDQDGMRHYLQSLSENVSRIELLRQIRFSPEGISRTNDVIGLDSVLTTTKREASPFSAALRVISNYLSSAFAGKRVGKRNEPSVVSLAKSPPTDFGVAVSALAEVDSDYAIVANSDLFSADYYRNAYQDVASAGIDPIKHFSEFGWKEGRNPSEKFNTIFYLETHPDVRDARINPLVHYIRFGKDEKRIKQPIELLPDISIFSRLITKNRQMQISRNREPIDVVIPIYNGFEYLGPLFNSIISNTSCPYRLIVVNDCSPDHRVREFLGEFSASHPSVSLIVIDNEKNLGFIGSVNRAMRNVRGHVVLLNSDTEVPPTWLERLMYPILEIENIATTTPFTNSGTICSFPLYPQDNPIYAGCSVAVLDSYFQMVNCPESYLEIPTGVGFCMGINKTVVEKIGLFDPCFGKGYGEENDWCMRARALGYKNLHVTNLFVYHKHGGSFPSEDRRRLIELNLSILREKHPTYEFEIQECIRVNKLKALREFLMMTISTSEFQTTVIFDNELGGGAHQYRVSHVKELIEKGYAVIVIALTAFHDNTAKLRFSFQSHSFSLTISDASDLLDLFKVVRVNEMLVNSFVSFTETSKWLAVARQLKKSTGCKLGFLLHDYHSVCPSYTLLNDKGVYCGVPGDLRICDTCLQRNDGEFRRFGPYPSILRWRSEWESFLESCDEIVVFSEVSRDILKKAYPKLDNSKFALRPHDISGRFRRIYRKPAYNRSKRIGILGGINTAKGSTIVCDLVRYIDSNNLSAKIVLIGDINVPIGGKAFEMTGRYDIKDLERIVSERNIDIFLVPSIWPETYSFTTDEVMQLGYPLIVFNIGAPAERVRGYSLGKVIEIADLPDALFG
jgi:O-antigen biosynthesis protein